MDSSRIIEVNLKPGIKHFSISEIIEEASRIFCFETPSTRNKLRDNIKKELERTLKGKRYYIEEGKTRPRKYFRSDVQHLLEVDLYDYFIKASKKQNENGLNTSKGRIGMLAVGYQEGLEKIADSEKSREIMVQQYRRQTEEWKADELDYFIRERDGELTEEDIEIRTRANIEKKRREIFFEFLYETFFDSLIEFDEAKFRVDLKYRLDGCDLPDDPIQVKATLDMMDNRKYYTPKKTPEEIENLLTKLGFKAND